MRELDQEEGSGVVASESSGLGVESTGVEGGDEIADTLPLHTHIWRQDIVPHLAAGRQR